MLKELELWSVPKPAQTSETSKVIQKVKEEGTLSKSLYEATKTLITKPDKDTTKKENYRSISLSIFLKSKIIASSPIISWQIEEENV